MAKPPSSRAIGTSTKLYLEKGADGLCHKVEVARLKLSLEKQKKISDSLEVKIKQLKHKQVAQEADTKTLRNQLTIYR